jgi:hypothetical protein
MKKTAMRSYNQSFDPDPAQHIDRAVDISGTFEVDNNQDLIELIWKYFGEEIREALAEGEEALAAETALTPVGKSSN